ncbi:MAG: hypothetical protein ACXV3F_05165 [Frankiaceae bacterium]
MPFSVTALALYDEDRDGAEAAVDELAARLQPHATGGSFLNFLMDPAKTRTAYPAEGYRRLAAAGGGQTDLGPEDNFFHLNHNIPPS